jgi:transcriptional regulator with XRE-family HTH domain
MDLTTWMAKNGKTDGEIADAVGCTRPYINRIRNGLVHPNLGLSLEIWNHTKRQIDLEQLLPRAMRPKLKQPALPANPRGRPRKPAAPKASRPRAAA